MSQRIVAGFVDPQGDEDDEEGEIIGSGFEVRRLGNPGTFDIVFNQPFREAPSVVASQVYPVNPETDLMINTLANVIILGISKFKFRLTVGAPNGRPVSRAFTFVAIGKWGTPPSPTKLLKCLKEDG